MQIKTTLAHLKLTQHCESPTVQHEIKMKEKNYTAKASFLYHIGYNPETYTQGLGQKSSLLYIAGGDAKCYPLC